MALVAFTEQEHVSERLLESGSGASSDSPLLLLLLLALEPTAERPRDAIKAK